jgi:hypothetical protein
MFLLVPLSRHNSIAKASNQNVGNWLHLWQVFFHQSKQMVGSQKALVKSKAAQFWAQGYMGNSQDVITIWNEISEIEITMISV